MTSMSGSSCPSPNLISLVISPLHDKKNVIISTKERGGGDGRWLDPRGNLRRSLSPVSTIVQGIQSPMGNGHPSLRQALTTPEFRTGTKTLTRLGQILRAATGQTLSGAAPIGAIIYESVTWICTGFSSHYQTGTLHATMHACKHTRCTISPHQPPIDYS